MARKVKHLSFHRIAGTELRVVSDVEAGVLQAVGEEEAVLRGYAQRQDWPHREVTLFILQDLAPLLRELPAEADLPPGGVAALERRPVVNIYDLANLRSCHVFVNQGAMVQEGYWGDPLATRGLLAHEHAHPLAENPSTGACRHARVELWWGEPSSEIASLAGSQEARQFATLRDRGLHLLGELADKLCLYGPREVFANEVAIQSGFAEALLHLDRLNMRNACRSVAGRQNLWRSLEEETARGQLALREAELLLFIGDLRGYLDLALEVAPFYRSGRGKEARELEIALEAEVFPQLDPEVSRAYTRLRTQYIALRPDMNPAGLESWGREVLEGLGQALTEKGVAWGYRWLRIEDK